MKKLKPAHPGKLLSDEFIKPMNLTAYRVVKDSGIAQSILAAIVGGHRSISAETAMRLGSILASTLSSGSIFKADTIS